MKQEETKPPKARALRVANLPREICRHTVGHDHSTLHRLVCGMGVMGFGVVFAMIPTLAEIHALFAHMGFELVGFAIHGLGAVPYIEWLLEERIA